MQDKRGGRKNWPHEDLKLLNFREKFLFVIWRCCSKRSRITQTVEQCLKVTVFLWVTKKKKRKTRIKLVCNSHWRELLRKSSISTRPSDDWLHKYYANTTRLPTQVTLPLRTCTHHIWYMYIMAIYLMYKIFTRFIRLSFLGNIDKIFFP